MSDIKETKACPFCNSLIDKKASLCVNCGKMLTGKKKSNTWIVFVVIAFVFIIGIGAIGSDEEASTDNSEQSPNSTNNNNSQSTNNNSDANTEEESHENKNEFVVGDIVETSDFKISFISSSEWESDNMFVEPKDGYVFYRFEFEFENISKSDQYVSSADFECYADGYSMESSYYGDDILSITSLSSGKKVKGSVCFEVPKDAESIILEYGTNFWTENKIVFVIK